MDDTRGSNAAKMGCHLQVHPEPSTLKSKVQVKKSKARLCIDFAKKYFMEGQNLKDNTGQLIPEQNDFSSNSSFDDNIFVNNNTKGNNDVRSTNNGNNIKSASISSSTSIPPEGSITTPNLLRRFLSNRRLIGILLPLVFFHVCWWCLAIKHNFFKYFQDKYVMTLTMVGGAMIAGLFCH